MKGAFTLTMHNINIILCIDYKKEAYMRTTLDIPENLMAEALEITNARTKTDLIKLALRNIIRKNHIQALKQFRGKISLDIDLEAVRKRV